MDMLSTTSRRGSRAAALVVPAVVVTGSLLIAGPAAAAPPEQWEVPANPPLSELLLVLVGIPAVIVAVIALLTYLPSMVRGQSGTSVAAFDQNPEWFGGPREGADAVEGGKGSDGTTGGASARW